MTTEDRAEAIVARCRPLTTAGAELLRRYLASIHFGGAPGTQENELVNLRELCRIVEQVPFDTLSIHLFRELKAASAPSPTAARRRGRVLGRLLCLLQQSGELPTASEVTASHAIERELALTPKGGQGTLRRWLAQRKRKLGWHDLRWEAHRLRLLEAILAEHPDIEDGEAVLRWLRMLVHRVVDCDCAPITRRADPTACSCCSATIASHGDRPSPGERKQKELRALARRYLQFRRLPTPTAVI